MGGFRGRIRKINDIGIYIKYLNVLFSALSLQSPETTNEQTYTWLLYTLMIVPSIVTIFFTFVKESYARSEETSNLGISESHNLDTENRLSD